MRFFIFFISVFLVFSNFDWLFAKQERTTGGKSPQELMPVKVLRTDDSVLNSILNATGKYNNKMVYSRPSPFPVTHTGKEEWVDYEKYGTFENVGTERYKYVVKEDASDDLKDASGSGVYPNKDSVYNEKDYKKYKDSGKLDGSVWDFVDSYDYQADFYKWSTVLEEPGVKLFYTASALDKAGNYKHAVKAYYACLVFFPKSIGYTQWKTPWYIAPACIDRIKYLTREYPQIGVKLVDAKVTIKNRFDNDKNNDVFFVNPGKLVRATASDFIRKHKDLEKIKAKKTVGTGNVKLIEYENGHFALKVGGKPYVVRAVCYSPTRPGLSPDDGSVNVNRDWSVADFNKNGIADGPYEAWVDVNRNDIQDDNEKTVGDFALMKAMGINTIRLYHYPNFNKSLLKDGYENYGFMYMVGNMLGMYGVDSGADWFKGTDYTNEKQKQAMLNSVKKMVNEFKDEPYVLMWVLGNENNYGTVGVKGKFAGTSNQAQSQPDAYYAFVNECAKLIKSLDPKKRPVAICNGDVYLLSNFAKNCPDVDIYGANAYRGEQGFGALWSDVYDVAKKPVVVTEFGCPAYADSDDWSVAKIEKGQSSYHSGSWNNIEDNLAGVEGGVGNALGGVVFEWVDEWWKAGPPPEFNPAFHDTNPQWKGPFLDGGAYEEWFGICSMGDGENGGFKRQLRKSYFTYRDLWKKYKV
ncbi:MAG: hypothetical protein LBU55_04610 [Elusimicrobiota bacterium]|jgi:beta-glucuronidase|nr:hypothetical protein [Elusimicrobiota bacterium]